MHQEPVIPPEIRGRDQDSFANYTLLSRVPQIMQKIIDDNDFEANIIDALRGILSDIRDGYVMPLQGHKSEEDVIWQGYVLPHLQQTWLDVPFFFAEMYLYRRILETIGYFRVNEVQCADPFLRTKHQGLSSAIAHPQYIERLCNPSHYTEQNVLEGFQAILLANLWANRADLSQLSGGFNANSTDFGPEEANGLLSNDLSAVAEYVLNAGLTLKRVDLILDNAGMELLADLALADYLLGANLAQQVILHCKRDPVFVSDATMQDVDRTIQTLTTTHSTQLQVWAARLSAQMYNQQLVIKDHPFWNLPLYFREMPDRLRQDFAQSDLIISKGDANYRRLVDDRHWNFTTPIADVVNYLPAPCLALRVLKCEVLVGITAETLATVSKEPNWMINGNYALIQFVTAEFR